MSYYIPGMSFTAGSSGNRGIIPTDDGQLAYARPWPGAIVCRFVYPPEHYPVERLVVDATDGHFAFGVESMTAVAVLAGASLDVLLLADHQGRNPSGTGAAPLWAPVTP